MDPAAEAAIRASNDVFAADNRGVPQNAISDELRVFDKVGGTADDTWHQHLAWRQLRLLPHAPLMLVAHVAGLEGIGLRVVLTFKHHREVAALEPGEAETLLDNAARHRWMCWRFLWPGGNTTRTPPC